MRVVIIANGPSALKTEKRKFIDESDVVIRMNSFKTSGFEEFIGTKFDIYSCNPKHLYTIDILDDEERLRKSELIKRRKELREYAEDKTLTTEERKKFVDVWAPPKVESKNLLEIWCLGYDKKSDVPQFPFSDKIKVSDLHEDPNWAELGYTVGYKTLLYCLKHFKDCEVFITGLDNYVSTGWYWDKTPWKLRYAPTIQQSEEPLVLENLRVRELLKTGTIKKI